MCLGMDKLSKTRVLIVEDERDIAGLMKHALERGGDMGVEIVGTGAAALNVALPACVAWMVQVPAAIR